MLGNNEKSTIKKTIRGNRVSQKDIWSKVTEEVPEGYNNLMTLTRILEKIDGCIFIYTTYSIRIFLLELKRKLFHGNFAAL